MAMLGHSVALASALLGLALAKPQSNYNQQALSIEYEGEGLPQFGTLDGVVTELDTLSDTINLNRTEALLTCAAGQLSIDLKFKQPFYGIVYADYDRNSACKIAGSGQDKYNIQIPLKGCGTVQSPVRVFTNNIIVRFHHGLEIEGDEVITVVCRYPPPVVQPPLVPNLLQLPETPIVGTLQPLREFEILLIICAIIFLALLLLGIGCSYYCLKKRNIRVIRRRPASTIGSEVTRISDPPSMFEGLKIPRAHATDTSGSEELTESIHSDYPSEIASQISAEEFQSAYSDLGGEVEENVVFADLHEPPLPAFDIKMRMKKKAKTLTPMSSRASSVTEEMMAAQEQYLATILERTETNTIETLERIRKSNAELGPPPVHARLRVQHKAESITGRESDSESNYTADALATDNELLTEDELELPRPKMTIQSDRLQSARLVESVQVRETEMVTRREQEIRERQARQEAAQAFDVTVRTHESGHPGYSDEDTIDSMSEYTSENHIEPVLIDRSHYRQATDIDSRHYRQETNIAQMNMAQMSSTNIQLAQEMSSGYRMDQMTSGMHADYREGGDQGRQVSKFDVLIRVLDAPPPGASGGASASDRDDLTSVLSEDDRQRWRDIVNNDTEFREMLTTAQTSQEVSTAVSQMRYSSKFEKVFEPAKWDVIVRVLQAPGTFSAGTVSSKSTRSQRTSRSGATEYDLRSMTETTVDFGARKSEFDSESSVSGHTHGSGRYSQYARSTGARSARSGRSMADRSGTEITEYHNYMYAESHGTRSESRPSIGHFTSDEQDHEEF